MSMKNHIVLKHFQTVDPILYEAARKMGPFTLVKSDDYFMSLCREIIGQQLAGKAAEAIFNRFVGLFPDKKITIEYVLALPDEAIRAIGTSWAKARFIKDAAAKIHTKELDLSMLDGLSNEDVMAQLTKVKGIGPWTAEMFLMFTLARPDIFSHGDLGLFRAMQRLYKFKKASRKKIEQISQKWSPYRTYACLVLWDSLDRKEEQ